MYVVLVDGGYKNVLFCYGPFDHPWEARNWAKEAKELDIVRKNVYQYRYRVRYVMPEKEKI